MNILKLCYNVFRSHIVNVNNSYNGRIPMLRQKIEDTGPMLCLKRYNHSESAKPKLPELLYFPHIFRWLNAKYRLKYLQKMWDPEFSEGAFIYGTTHAICKITDIISRNKPDELKNFVDYRVEKKLSHEMRVILSDQQKQAMKLSPEDIKLLVPMKVIFDTNKNQKRCRILLKTLAMKWCKIGSSLKLVLIVLETEFKRDYTKTFSSEWIISLFNILQCSLISDSPPPRPPK